MQKTIRKDAPRVQNTRKPRSTGDRVFDWCVYILLALVLVIILYPLYFVLIASFSDPLEVIAGNVSFLPVRANLESYRLVFKNSQVMTGYRNTILYTLAGTSLNILMSICAAYPLSRPKLKGKGFGLAMMVFTMFFSGGMIPTYIIISDLGILDTFWVMILPTALSVYNVMIMRTFFSTSIPRELEEAAVVDGANKFQRVWHVDIPGILPTIVIMLILNAGKIMNVGFEKAYLMQTSLNIDASEIIATYVYKRGVLKAQISLSTAVGLFESVINMILVLTVNWISRKVTESSLF